VAPEGAAVSARTAAARDPLAPEFVLEILQSLVRIPSVNPTLAPEEGGGEAEIAGFVRDWLDARGIEARLEEAAPGRPNVFASVGADQGPTLVFCAHLDTVGTAGMTIPPFEPRVEGNRVYGRGSFDMKGGVAADPRGRGRAPGRRDSGAASSSRSWRMKSIRASERTTSCAAIAPTAAS
jgi:hypothetical protein